MRITAAPAPNKIQESKLQKLLERSLRKTGHLHHKKETEEEKKLETFSGAFAPTNVLHPP